MNKVKLVLLVISGLMFLAAACGGTTKVGRLRIHLGWAAFALWSFLAAMGEE